MTFKKKVNPMSKIKLSVFILLILFGCQQDKHEWNPIFEETSFGYLNTNIERSLSLIEEAYMEADETKQESIQKKLFRAKNRLLEIKDYYVPLTVVRQKIYDAERSYKLGNIEQAEKLLADSVSILSSLDVTTKSENFDKVILTLNSMINAVISSFNEGSTSNTYSKMKLVGERVNLMLSRGDLVLSGIEFEK
jgi:hypothetical protein